MAPNHDSPAESGYAERSPGIRHTQEELDEEITSFLNEQGIIPEEACDLLDSIMQTNRKTAQ